jgi:hypothetical protein
MKLEIYRDSNRRWSWNMLRDVDALSIAIPYCDVVVADKDAADLARRTKAPQRHGTVVISRLGELVDLLPDFARAAASVVDDSNGWAQVAPGTGYNLAPPRPLTLQDIEADCMVRMLDEDGTPTTSRLLSSASALRE